MSQNRRMQPRARQRYGLPKHPTDAMTLQPSPPQIRFLHPGYREEHGVLLVLPAIDEENGINHQTALDSCAVVANNRWDGFFTFDREGLRPMPTDKMDQSLDSDEYYFQVPSYNGVQEIDKDYPIVPTFAEWIFPHRNFPAHWLRDPSFNANSAGRCSLSNAASLLENAHIVPANRSDEQWFNENGMAEYASLHSNANIIRFKVDVHQYFDRKPKFAIVPKYGEMVAHMFDSKSMEAREAIELYHNVPVALGEQNTRFLLARLAWTIFPLLETFLKKGVKRRLLRKTDEGLTTREEDGDSCERIWASSRPRSASPAKRLRNERFEREEARDWDLYNNEECAGGEEQQRGRKRTRTSDCYTLDCCSTDSRIWLQSGSEVSESEEARLLMDIKS